MVDVHCANGAVFEALFHRHGPDVLLVPLRDLGPHVVPLPDALLVPLHDDDLPPARSVPVVVPIAGAVPPLAVNGVDALAVPVLAGNEHEAFAPIAVLAKAYVVRGEHGNRVSIAVRHLDPLVGVGAGLDVLLLVGSLRKGQCA